MGRALTDTDVEWCFRGATYHVPAEAVFYADEVDIRERYWKIRPGDSVYDIGASFGAYTLPALAVGARVCAIDPDRAALKVLKDAAALNGFSKLRTRRVALYDGTSLPKELKYQHEYDDVGHYFPSAQSPSSDARWSTLDTVAGDDRVDWIKIDVEGAELGVLRGAVRTLKRERSRLIVEDHSKVYEWVRRMGIADQIRVLLTGLGYRVRTVPYRVEGTAERDYLIAVPRG